MIAYKSLFYTHEIEYLGYILTRDGIKPQPKKAQATLMLNLPYNVKELGNFLGMVQSYQKMWAKHSEMPAPRTDLVGECGKTKTTKKNETKKKYWRWDAIHQHMIDNVKAAIAIEVVLAYSDFSKPFEIYTDASSTQLGVVIAQDNMPIAFFSRKLSKTQQKFSVTEIELLAMVEILKEFKGMLWGQDIKVFTDHNNLTRHALGITSDRVYRWRLHFKEYAPQKIYIKRKHNTVADAISGLDCDPKLNTTNNYTHAMLGVEPEELSLQQWKLCAHHWQSYNKSSTSTETHCFHMNEVFAYCSEEDKNYPLTTEEIAENQWADASLKHLVKRNALFDQGLEIKLIENTTCVCKDGWIVIPKPLQVCAVNWYHHYLQHPGHTCLNEMMNAVMYWKGKCTTIQSITKSYRSCQTNKRWKLKSGHLPPKTIISNPWECSCVDR
jgi:hypothetical protein